MKKSKKQTTVVIDRIESGFAYMQFSDGVTVPWPAERLPEGCAEGDAVNVALEISDEIKKRREKDIKELQ